MLGKARRWTWPEALLYRVYSLAGSWSEVEPYEDRLLRSRVHRVLGGELEKLKLIPKPLGGSWQASD